MAESKRARLDQTNSSCITRAVVGCSEPQGLSLTDTADTLQPDADLLQAAVEQKDWGTTARLLNKLVQFAAEISQPEPDMLEHHHHYSIVLDAVAKVLGERGNGIRVAQQVAVQTLHTLLQYKASLFQGLPAQLTQNVAELFTAVLQSTAIIDDTSVEFCHNLIIATQHSAQMLQAVRSSVSAYGLDKLGAIADCYLQQITSRVAEAVLLLPGLLAMNVKHIWRNTSVVQASFELLYHWSPHIVHFACTMWLMIITGMPKQTQQAPKCFVSLWTSKPGSVPRAWNLITAQISRYKARHSLPNNVTTSLFALLAKFASHPSVKGSITSSTGNRAGSNAVDAVLQAMQRHAECGPVTEPEQLGMLALSNSMLSALHGLLDGFLPKAMGDKLSRSVSCQATLKLLPALPALKNVEENKQMLSAPLSYKDVLLAGLVCLIDKYRAQNPNLKMGNWRTSKAAFLLARVCLHGDPAGPNHLVQQSCTTLVRLLSSAANPDNPGQNSPDWAEHVITKPLHNLILSEGVVQRLMQFAEQQLVAAYRDFWTLADYAKCGNSVLWHILSRRCSIVDAQGNELCPTLQPWLGLKLAAGYSDISHSINHEAAPLAASLLLSARQTNLNTSQATIIRAALYKVSDCLISDACKTLWCNRLQNLAHTLADPQQRSGTTAALLILHHLDRQKTLLLQRRQAQQETRMRAQSSSDPSAASASATSAPQLQSAACASHTDAPSSLTAATSPIPAASITTTCHPAQTASPDPEDSCDWPDVTLSFQPTRLTYQQAITAVVPKETVRHCMLLREHVQLKSSKAWKKGISIPADEILCAASARCCVSIMSGYHGKAQPESTDGQNKLDWLMQQENIRDANPQFICLLHLEYTACALGDTAVAAAAANELLARITLAELPGISQRVAQARSQGVRVAPTVISRIAHVAAAAIPELLANGEFKEVQPAAEYIVEGLFDVRQC